MRVCLSSVKEPTERCRDLIGLAVVSEPDRPRGDSKGGDSMGEALPDVRLESNEEDGDAPTEA